MRPSPTPLLAATTLVGLLACADRGAGEAGAAKAARQSTTDAEPSAPSTRSPALDDPYESFEGLRPREHASWPVENVDIERYAGWRIEPASGGFGYEEGLVFETAAHEFVLAIADGEVLAVERDAENNLSLIIDHGHGIHSHYAPLADALVHAGMPVGRGSAIALTTKRGLRLRVLVDEVAIDPALALRQPLHRWPARLRSLPPPPPPQDH